MASTVPSDFSTTSDAAAGSGSGSTSAPVSSTPQGDFSSDPRVYYNTQTGKWQFEDDDGNEFEWDQLRNTWAPVVSQASAFFFSAGWILLTRDLRIEVCRWTTSSSKLSRGPTRWQASTRA